MRTVARAVRLAGTGLHSGASCAVTVHPAGSEGGIWFRAEESRFRVQPAAVRPSQLCSRLQGPSGAAVSTVEHLLAALHGGSAVAASEKRSSRLSAQRCSCGAWRLRWRVPRCPFSTGRPFPLPRRCWTPARRTWATRRRHRCGLAGTLAFPCVCAAASTHGIPHAGLNGSIRRFFSGRCRVFVPWRPNHAIPGARLPTTMSTPPRSQCARQTALCPFLLPLNFLACVHCRAVACSGSA